MNIKKDRVSLDEIRATEKLGRMMDAEPLRLLSVIFFSIVALESGYFM